MKCCCNNNNNNNNNNNKHIWKVTYTFIAKENTHFKESFGLILQNQKLICVIGTVQSYLGFWGERLNFGITLSKFNQKYEREEEKGGKRKCWISATVIPNFLCPVLLPVRGVPEVKRKK